jgi:hypothetical protein
MSLNGKKLIGAALACWMANPRSTTKERRRKAEPVRMFNLR